MQLSSNMSLLTRRLPGTFRELPSYSPRYSPRTSFAIAKALLARGTPA